MRRFLLGLDTFTNWFGNGWALLALPLIGVVVYEVIARFVFNAPTMWAHETTYLLFGVWVIVGGAYCFLHGSHVKVDIFYAGLSTRGKAIADLATSGLSLLVIGLMVWFAIPYAWEAVVERERSITVLQSPIYPSKVFLLIGALWLLVMIIGKSIKDLYKVTKRIQSEEKVSVE